MNPPIKKTNTRILYLWLCNVQVIEGVEEELCPEEHFSKFIATYFLKRDFKYKIKVWNDNM